MVTNPPYSQSPVLVTGGLGFIGGHLLERLVATGLSNIRVVDNTRRAVCAAKTYPAGAVCLHPGDIRDCDVLSQAIHGCEIVFHLAAQSNVLGCVQDPEYAFSTNVLGTMRVLQAARQAGVRRVVFASSREVYGDPDLIPVPECAPLVPRSEYGASKAAAEMYCRAAAGSGLEISILRLANVYGPYDRDRVVPLFINAALSGEPLTLYGGDQIIDLVWIDIVVSALMRAGFGDYVPGPVNIGSGVGLTVAQLAERVLALTQSKSECLRRPFRNIEVSRFVAEITLGQRLLGLPIEQDTLAHLPDVIEWTRSMMEARSEPKAHSVSSVT